MATTAPTNVTVSRVLPAKRTPGLVFNQKEAVSRDILSTSLEVLTIVDCVSSSFGHFSSFLESVKETSAFLSFEIYLLHKFCNK